MEEQPLPAESSAQITDQNQEAALQQEVPGSTIAKVAADQPAADDIDFDNLE